MGQILPVQESRMVSHLLLRYLRQGLPLLRTLPTPALLLMLIILDFPMVLNITMLSLHTIGMALIVKPIATAWRPPFQPIMPIPYRPPRQVIPLYFPLQRPAQHK